MHRTLVNSRLTHSLTVCLLLFLSAPGSADASGVGSSDAVAVERLTELLADIDTFEANVNQLIVESTGGVLEESEIRFVLKRPHGFYWETLEPFPELIVTDGKLLWNYQPDLLQVTIERWQAERTELAARLLSGEMEGITAEYTITAAQPAAGGPDWEFFLVPLDPGSVYDRVTLFFEDGELDSMHLDNGNGQKTLWQFYNRRLNAPVEDSLFRFEPPANIEIIDNSQAR
jgi:outer membrane lipoprotein carrier protein